MHAYSGENGPTSGLLGLGATLSLLVAWVAQYLSGFLPQIPSWVWSTPTFAGVLWLLYVFTDRTAWRWPLLQRLNLTKTPVIEGAYEGTLVSSFNNVTLPVRLTIDQTWTRISIRFEVLQPSSSTSYSTTAGLFADGHHRTRLTYTYRNQPQPGIADPQLADHDGTTEISINADNGKVAGRYYNYRGNRGTLSLQRIDRHERDD